MHAYAIIGEDQFANSEAEKLAKEKSTSYFSRQVTKISELNDYLSDIYLSKTKKTTYILLNFDKASVETQNAFLKRLEEPQKNVFFIITAENEEALLPTILSRVSIQRITKNASTKIGDVEFLESDTTKRLEEISKIRKREDAIGFVKGIIDKSKFNPKYISKLAFLELAYRNLQANGNASLQLTNLVVNLDNS